MAGEGTVDKGAGGIWVDAQVFDKGLLWSRRGRLGFPLLCKHAAHSSIIDRAQPHVYVCASRPYLTTLWPVPVLGRPPTGGSSSAPPQRSCLQR